MSISHQYHQPNAPDSDDDHDSDLELDLHELDPVSSSAVASSSGRSRDGRGIAQQLGSHIPLRNLRYSRLRGNRRNTSSHDHDDLNGLLDDDEDARKRYSAASSGGGDDDAPLLPTHFSRPRPRRSEGSLARITSRLRIPSFITGAQAPTPGGNEDEEEADVEHDPSSTRTIPVGQRQSTRFPLNAVSNAKYTPWSFLPLTLYNEFSFFFNMYFLLVALSQAIPALRIGYISTYIVPLAFVLMISIGKEAIDDIQRRRRDAEANSEPYTVLKFGDGEEGPDGNSNVREMKKPSRSLKVGDVLKLGKNQRVPADVVILKSISADDAAIKSSLDVNANTENLEALISTDLGAAQPQPTESAEGNPGPTGEAFIRTDQLDGETDWKLRLASPSTQNISIEEFMKLKVVAGKPDKKVNDFVGTVELEDSVSGTHDDAEQANSWPLSIDNTAWANTVIASTCTLYAVVVYTGSQTRQALSTSTSRSKTGRLEYEINSLTKILCLLTFALSFILVALEGFEAREDGRKWYVSVMIYLILFSTIVPVNLRVNVDMAKSVYAWQIEHDKDIPDTVVRTSTIPEDLGRVEYLLSDKTGTLTQNEMEMKKIHVGTVSYANEAMDEVASYVRQTFANSPEERSSLLTPSSANVVSTSATRTRREIGARVRDIVLTLALCHNVTPTIEDEDGTSVTTYQASSPDEIAIVKWAETVGLRLLHRDRVSISLQSTETGRVVVRVRILNIFPFTSEGKRMGILVQFSKTSTALPTEVDEDSEIWFYQKGADTVMANIVASNDWLEEETSNMAREGLRTLVVGRKQLSPALYREFTRVYAEASLSLQGRDANMASAVESYLEHDLELLGVTGVEDKLQKDVKPSLELLRNAGVKVWMLTGDKVETARCVAISSKLVARGQHIHTIAKLKRKDAALPTLDLLHTHPSTCLLIDGDSLSIMLTHHRATFIPIAIRLPTVIACRCTPTQKADLARLIRTHTGARVACIGDGGNDVSMILAADVGIGIVGKEGRQASLAADFSVPQFHYVTRLLVWHGRNSYKRSAKLALFVMHRGLIFAVCQTVFSVASAFEPIALFKDWLLVGYATVYTMVPVFSLVLDRDVDEGVANLYPELYKELTSGRSLSYRTFGVWVLVSVYQGCIIQGVTQLLVGIDNFPRMVAVSYTALVLNELLMIAAEVTTWHWAMIVSLLATAGLFFGSFPFLGEYFDLKYVISVAFVWKVVVAVALALVPPYAGKILNRTLRPPNYRKVQAV
ncbi:phospholipid-translocating P-type ATPase-like protein [Eremomyces bilateralis CBS 781.70]|uniref:Phospholipid-transporting ATPase n=1 Tax=Eremomyces bilateralis CBS 781.70 TaxID=1392243 RepID=A0A6G1FX91_9PEZI|nr:phospholipid-translocating P-type ATPase-like protein [Eremomyces bilateralis CBS 781.70]KAF1810239.1 phospholipid-translocating P-type ATPase-like protein [Eremomyces bilateralis CBS 781.70]